VSKLLFDNLGRAIVVSLVVGTALVMINHGDHIQKEPICDHFYFKGALCYVVPFLVSLVSAMMAGRAGGGRSP
jgi:hypothetical protein